MVDRPLGNAPGNGFVDISVGWSGASEFSDGDLEIIGGLIHTAVGTGSGIGRPLTNLSGWALKAAASVFARESKAIWAKP